MLGGAVGGGAFGDLRPVARNKNPCGLESLAQRGVGREKGVAHRAFYRGQVQWKGIGLTKGTVQAGKVFRALAAGKVGVLAVE